MMDSAYPHLSSADKQRILALNAKNGYGLSRHQVLCLIAFHKRARAAGNIRQMSRIEYRLTDINFHQECSLLHQGKYEEARALWQAHT